MLTKQIKQSVVDMQCMVSGENLNDVPKGYTLERVECSDLRLYMRVRSEIFGSESYYAYIAKCIDCWLDIVKRGRHLYFFKRDEVILGICTVRPVHMFPYVSDFGIIKSARGLGLGRLFMTSLLKAYSGHILQLRVNTSNEAAYGLYTSMGFTEMQM